MMEPDDAHEDLIGLLHGSEKAGGVAAEILCSTVHYSALPDLFHRLVTDCLLHEEWTTRLNTAHALQRLSAKHRRLLLADISCSASDGELLKLAQLDVPGILNCGYVQLLRANPFEASAKQQQQHLGGQRIYSKQWLQQQRQHLIQKLGIDCTDAHAGAAYHFDSTAQLVSKEDVQPQHRSSEGLKVSDIDIPDISHADDQSVTNEYWIVRLIRFMVIGLYDARWETRHGCSLGLIRIMTGLRAVEVGGDKNPADLDVETESVAMVQLPDYIVEDIVSSGICVLLFDKFLDISDDGAVMISPVKEILSQLIACGTMNLATKEKLSNSGFQMQKQERILAILCQICNLMDEEWSLRIGGLIALKYVIVTVSAHAFRAHAANIIAVIADGLNEAAIDMNIAACLLLKSMHKTIESHGRDSDLSSLLLEGERLLIAMHTTCANLTALDSQVHIVQAGLHDALCVSLFDCASRDNEDERGECYRAHICCLATCQVLNKSMLPNLLSFSNDVLESFSVKIFVDHLSSLISIMSETVSITNHERNVPLLWELLCQILAIFETALKVVDRWNIWRNEQWQSNESVALGKLEIDTHVSLSLFGRQAGILVGSTIELLLAFDIRIAAYGFRAFSTMLLPTVMGYYVKHQDSEVCCLKRTKEMLQFSFNVIFDDISGDPEPQQDDIEDIAIFETVEDANELELLAEGDDDKLDNLDLVDTHKTSLSPTLSSSAVNLSGRKRRIVDTSQLPRRSERLATKRPVKYASFSLKDLRSHGEPIKPYRRTIDPNRIDPLQTLTHTSIDHFFEGVNSKSASIGPSLIGLAAPTSDALQIPADFMLGHVVGTLRRIVDEDFSGLVMQLSSEVDVLSATEASSGASRATGPIRKKLSIVITGLTSSKIRFERDLPISLGSSASDAACSQHRKTIDSLLVQIIKCCQSIQQYLLFLFKSAGCNENEFENLRRLCSDLALATSVDRIRHDHPFISNHRNYQLLVRNSLHDIHVLLSTSVLFPHSPAPSLSDIIFQLSSIKDISLRTEGAYICSSRWMTDSSKLNELIRSISIMSRFDEQDAPETLCANNLKWFFLRHAAHEMQISLVEVVLEFSRRAIIESRSQALQLVQMLHAITSVLFPATIAHMVKHCQFNETLLDCTFICAEDRHVETVHVLCAILASFMRQSQYSRAVAESTSALINQCIHVIELHLQIHTSVNARIMAAALLHEAVLCIKDSNILSVSHRDWISVALQYIGDFDLSVRKQAMAALRLLVPYAKLMQLERSNEPSIDSASDVVISRVLACVDPPDILSCPQFAASIAFLRANTELFDENSQSSHCNPPGSLITSCSAQYPLALRPYQWIGISWLLHLWQCNLGGCLLDQMGLGKTVQALTALAIFRIQKKFDTAPSLIICPASLRLHWFREIQKFFKPDLLSPIYFDSSVQFDTYRSSDVVIVSYDIFRQQMSNNSKPGDASFIWEAAIVDEAHVLRNPTTKLARAIFGLKSKVRLALTGTPIQNQVQDMWSLMNFVMPGFLGDFQQFKNTVIIPVSKSIEERASLSSTAGNRKTLLKTMDITSEGLGILHHLHSQVTPFMMRRTKNSVALELPPKEIIDIFCPLSIVQRQLYASFQKGLSISDDDLERELISKPTDKVDLSAANSARLHPLKALRYLQLLCVHPSLVISAEHRHYKNRLLAEPNASGKMTQLARLLIESNVLDDTDCCNMAQLFDEHVNVARDDHYSDRDNDSYDDSDSHAAVEEGGAPWYQADCNEGSDDDSEIDSQEEDPLDAVDKNSTSNVDCSHEQPRRFQSKPAALSALAQRRNVVHALNINVQVPSATSEKSLPIGLPEDIGKSMDTEATGSTHVSATSDGSVANAKRRAAGGAHPCLIFAQHQSTLDLIESCVLHRYFPAVSYAKLDGRVPAQVRAEIIQAFNDGHTWQANADASYSQLQSHSASHRLPKVAFCDQRAQGSDPGEPLSEPPPKVLLMTARSCGLGVNLNAADTVIFIEHDWNPFVDLQAMDRAHRIGQRKPVTVYRLLAESTIEARINYLQDLKQFLSNEILQGNSADRNSEQAATFKSQLAPSLGIALWRSITSAAQATEDGSSVGTHQSSTPNEQYDAFDPENFLKSIKPA